MNFNQLIFLIATIPVIAAVFIHIETLQIPTSVILFLNILSNVFQLHMVEIKEELVPSRFGVWDRGGEEGCILFLESLITHAHALQRLTSK